MRDSLNEMKAIPKKHFFAKMRDSLNEMKAIPEKHF